MRTSKLLLFLFALLASRSAHAQSPLPIPRNLQTTYDRGTRSPDGQPGPRYWQNTADYQIRMRFDPATRRVSGDEDITYTNNSPDTLMRLCFKLYPNLYKAGNERMMRIDSADVSAGVQLSGAKENGAALSEKSLRTDGTNMYWRLKQRLAPGQSVRLSLGFSYVLNKDSHIRTGEIDPGAWFIAYFFPRVAVYDDIDGWNTFPYLGTQEFYNDFCNFELAVTVPKDYVVWATGDLTNCAEVLAPKFCQRIADAEISDDITTIIDSTDLLAGGITANHPENTFRFKAKNVTDVAVAISNHYMWKASSLMVDWYTERRTRVDAVFNPVHKDYFEVIQYARKTVKAMSFEFPRWPYPYSHETVFDGLDQMEYPMMVNDNPLEDVAEAIELTDHEIFHTMFPFYMGINETKYGWMDEGWATIGEWLISPMIDSSIVDDYGMLRYELAAGTEYDTPIMTLTTEEGRTAQFLNSYPKPAMGYLYVKDLLGDEVFFKGLHHYIRTWNGKHPMPYDFFNCMNTGSGVNLDWFWKRWFFDNGVPDLAITQCIPGKKEQSILIESKGTKPVPVDLLVTFTDGSEQKLHYTIAVWEKGGRTFSVKLNTEKQVKNIRLGSTYVPDVNKKDNVWEMK